MTAELHTNGSKLGLGGVLLQNQADNSLQMIYYYSRATIKAEHNYHIYKLDALAVVEWRFRNYPLGVHISKW